MSFPQFAFNNVRRNARAYIAYLLSSAFMVMIFFTYAVFIYHPRIAESEMGNMTRAGMSIATVIVYVFAFFFVLYSISVFLKSRNREFGILTILGAESRQINLLILLENMLIGTVAIVTGIAAGLLLSKLFLLISTKVIDIEELPFYWPVKAILLTTGAFVLLFLFISIFTLVFIRKSQVLELLKGSSKPKKEPRANVFTATLGILLLTIGYLALHAKKLDEIGLLIAAVSGIAGTYFFYSQLSVWLTRRLQRSRHIAWKGANLLWTSEMSYKLKDNARMLFLVTVVVALACMSTGFVLAYEKQIRDVYRDDPFAVKYSSYRDSDPQLVQKEINYIKERFEQAGLAYSFVDLKMMSTSGYSNTIMLISQTDYNHVASALHIELIDSLAPSEAVLVQTDTAVQKYPAADTMELQVEESVWQLSYTYRENDIATLTYSGPLLVIPDSLFAQYAEDYDGHIEYNNVFVIPETGKLPTKDDPEARLAIELTNWIRDGQHEGYLQARAENYYTNKQSFSLFSFIGVFIAMIFSVSSASFLYFKLHTELAADATMYRSLSKIGLSSREMNISATIQIAMLFYIPILVASIQSLVVLGPVMEVMNTTEAVYRPVLVASAIYLAVQTVYFLIVRARYIKKVNQTMV